MRRIVTMRMVSISVLLALPTGASLSRINGRLTESENTASAAQNTFDKATEKLLAGQRDIKRSIEKSSCEIRHGMGRLLAIYTGISAEVERFNDHQDRLVQHHQQNVTAMRHMKNSFWAWTASTRALFNIVPLFSKVSKDVLEYLRRLHKGNVEIYAILLRIHQSLPRPPTSQLDDNILFIDVLNRQHSLPYAYFQHWEVFESMLRCAFKGKPGENKVQCGRYLILDVKLPGKTFRREDWDLIVPGSGIYMSIILTRAYGTKTQCPRESCSGVSPEDESTISENKLVECDACGLQFVPYSKGKFHSKDPEATSPRLLNTPSAKFLDSTREFLNRIALYPQPAGSSGWLHLPSLTDLDHWADSEESGIVRIPERANHNIALLCACLRAILSFRCLATQLRKREQEELRAFKKVHITIIPEARSMENYFQAEATNETTPRSPGSSNVDSPLEGNSEISSQRFAGLNNMLQQPSGMFIRSRRSGNNHRW